MLPAMNSLKRLEISLEIMHPRLVGLKGLPSELQGALENTLSPIQAMTGLERASVESHITFYHLGRARFGAGHSGAYITNDDLQAVVKEFFKAIATVEIRTGAACHV
jgi:hypothetical protein